LLGNELVPRAVPAAAAPVHKKDKHCRPFGDIERAVEPHGSGWDLDFIHIETFGLD